MQLAFLFKRRDFYIVPIAYLAFGLVLYLIQDRLIYLPEYRVHGVCNLPTHGEVIDSEELRGYYIPFQYTTTSTPQARLAVYYPGNASNACDGMFFYPTLESAGYSVLLVQYPGYAGDNQSPSSQKILDIIPEVVSYIEEREYDEIVLIGQSVGSAFASYHSTLAPIDTLILMTPFDTLSARAQRAVWIYPARLLLKTDLLVKEWAKASPEVHIIAAAEDEVIPRRHTDRVYETLNPETTTYTVIEHTSHNTLYADPRFLEVFADLLPAPNVRE